MQDVHRLEVPGSPLQIRVRLLTPGCKTRAAGLLHARTRVPLTRAPPTPVHPPPTLQDCLDLADAQRSYFGQLFPLNPGAIVPSGPTAAELGLTMEGAGPGRGPTAFEQAFHLKQQAA